MHMETPMGSGPPSAAEGPWYRELTRYHWFVLLVSALGWLFDCMDQQLFNLARNPAIRELMGPQDVQWYGSLVTTIFMLGWATGGIIFGIMGDRVGRAKTMVLTILIYSLCTGLSALSTGFWDFALYRFLTALGVGGEFAVGVALVAEVMPDRARPHALGWLQALSAVGNVTAALISMTLASYETAGTFGAIQPWRIMFVIGALPALLALVVRRRLKEPEHWVALRSGQVPGQKLGSISELFHTPTLRKNALLGLVLATSGVVGLWGIGFFGFDLVRSVFREQFEKEGRTAEVISEEREFVRLLVQDPQAQVKFSAGQAKEEISSRLQLSTSKVKPSNLLDAEARLLFQAVVDLHKKEATITIDAVLLKALANAAASDIKTNQDQLRALLQQQPATSSIFGPILGEINQRTRDIDGRLTLWAGIYGLLFNIGAFFGIHFFSKVTHYFGRKPAFLITFILALVSTANTFWNLKQFSDIYWMVPAMGFCQIALFGGYAIYFPELFPTRLRSTGTSFCYNVGRFAAAPGPLLMGSLGMWMFGHLGEVASWRYAGVTMCAFFLIGIVVLPFLPETRGKPLPE